MEMARSSGLVTGGSGDLGRAIALALAQAGASVAVTYVGDRERAQLTAEEIEGEGQEGAIIFQNLEHRLGWPGSPPVWPREPVGNAPPVPAYRLGPKRIAVRAVDLAGLIAPRPVQGETGRGLDRGERITVRPLSDKEQQQLYAAVEAARRHQAELLAQRGGEPFPDSTELIREAREEWTRELMRALDE